MDRQRLKEGLEYSFTVAENSLSQADIQVGEFYL
jgi:hypothetical protein